MKEHTFNAKTMSWHKDEKGFDVLVVRCFESEDAKLVINCGAHQKRLVDECAPAEIIVNDGL